MKPQPVHSQQNYFLSHSVGLPFEGMKEDFASNYFDHWHNENEPWPHWIGGINAFREQLATLINADINEICPQSNLSSGLTKLIHALPKPATSKNVILCSAEDFPSMAFVLEKAKSLGYELQLIPENSDLHDVAIWEQFLTEETALCLITHVQSNNGHQLPVEKIIDCCRNKQVLSLVDIAQSIGLFEIDTKKWHADFILGSCVKWLCGGPGAGFLWVKSSNLEMCQPVDVGWFSHDNPFEFDIRHFKYADSALKFWGGTPTVAPYIHAAFAIKQVMARGVKNMRTINFDYLTQIHQAVSSINPDFIKSPIEQSKCSGTAILHFGEQQPKFVSALTQANIAFDERPLGVRLSPHYYNTQQEMDNLLNCIKSI